MCEKKGNGESFLPLNSAVTRYIHAADSDQIREGKWSDCPPCTTPFSVIGSALVGCYRASVFRRTPPRHRRSCFHPSPCQPSSPPPLISRFMRTPCASTDRRRACGSGGVAWCSCYGDRRAGRRRRGRRRGGGRREAEGRAFTCDWGWAAARRLP